MVKFPGSLFGLCLCIPLCGCDWFSARTPQNSQASETTRSPATQQTQPAPPPPGEATWPIWRGPQRDGISSETEWQTDWSPPPPVLWKNQIGIGYSSVSVAQGKLLTMGHVAGSDQETVWCFNATTGAALWSVTYPCTLLDHLHKGGPGATPTIDGEYVYTTSREGEVRKIELATGEVKWICDLRAELGIPLPEWGFTCSPVPYKKMILMEAGSVLAIDQQTGKVLWKTQPRMPGYGTPELFEFEEKPYLAALNNEGLSIIDLDQQTELTFFDWDSPYKTNATTPIWNEGSLFISTGYNIGCALLKFDGTSLSPEWQNKNMRNHMNSCILKDGFLYGFDGNSHNRRVVTFNCIDWETGNVRWSVRNLGCGAVSATHEFLLVMSDDGELLLGRMSPDRFDERGRVRVMKEQCWTVPTLCNSLIYCRGADGTLACVDVRLPDSP